MTADQMAMAAVQAHFEHVNWGSAPGRLCHVDAAFVWTCHVDGQTCHGPDGYAAYLERWRRALPGCWCEVRAFAVAGEVVTCQMMLRGRHDGLLETCLGIIPATGKFVDLPVCEIFHTRHGRLTAIESYYDLSTLVRQLGRCPTYNMPTTQMLLMN